MSTFFATPEKAGQQELLDQIDCTCKSPVVDGIMEAVVGLLAVTNEQRQIVALNNGLLQTLRIDGPHEVLGLRLGEALNCIHAKEEPAGCGTTKYCATCGVAIATVACLDTNKKREAKCALTVRRNGTTEDFCFKVKASPMQLNDQRFILIFLQDITLMERRTLLEKMFYHDLGNIITALASMSFVLARSEDTKKIKDLAQEINALTCRLNKEVTFQRTLDAEYECGFAPNLEMISLGDFLDELEEFFKKHPEGQTKSVVCVKPDPDNYITTDSYILFRVLTNMVLNALEATEPGGMVKVWTEEEGAMVSFCVWNRQPIDESIALRIFQKHFSTKNGNGRGFGTYSMKLLGEQFLGGKVSFSTSEDGTIFTLGLSV